MRRVAAVGLLVRRLRLLVHRLLRLLWGVITHVDGHRLQQAAVYLVQLGQETGHLLGLAAEDGAVHHRAVVHLADAVQAAVNALDGLHLHADALHLRLVDGVQVGHVVVQLLHLPYVSLGVLAEALGIVGDALIGVQQRVGSVVQRACHLVETLHVRRDAGHLLQVFLGGLRQLRHLGDLLGGAAQLLDTLRKVLRVLLADVEVAGDVQRAASDVHATRAALHRRRPRLRGVNQVLLGINRSGYRGVETGTVHRVLRAQHGEDILPVILFRRVLERRDEEHDRFRDHRHEQDLVRVGQVQQLEQRAQDNDRRAPAIHEIQEAFPSVAGEEHLNPVFISSILSHGRIYLSCLN